MNFKVKKLEEYEVSVKEVAASLACASEEVKANFIAEFFGNMNSSEVDSLAKRMSASGFHRGDKALEMLCAAIKYDNYKNKEK